MSDATVQRWSVTVASWGYCTFLKDGLSEADAENFMLHMWKTSKDITLIHRWPDGTMFCGTVGTFTAWARKESA